MNLQEYTAIVYIESDSSLPTLTGSAVGEKGKPGAYARLSVAGEFYEIPVDPLTGLYTWTATRPLPDGDYSLSVSIRDSAGNIGQPTLATLRIDTTPPQPPLLIKLYDDFGPEQRGFEPGDKTDDKRPTLTGIAQRGATVYLLNEQGERIGSAVADKESGLWQMDPAQDLSEGSNNLRLVAEEVFAGKTRIGTPSAPFNIIIESSTLPPGTVTINHAFDDVGYATGELNNGALTDDTRPELRGNASLGSTVTIYYRLAGSNLWLGSATATVSGESWSWTPGSALETGNYEFQASIGNSASALFSLDIASLAEIIARTRIDYVIDDAGTTRGPLSNGALTDDTTPTFVGSGEANSKVVLRLTRNAGLSATVVVDVDSAGHWSWTPAPPLTTGHWSFQLQVAGDDSWSAPFTLDISTDASYLGASIEYAVDNVGPVTDILRNGSTTDDATPTLQGRAEANSTVLLRYSLTGQSAVVLSLNADSSGHWSWTPPALANGSWNFEVYNATLNRWSSFKLNIDTNSDLLPTFDYAIDNVGPVTGLLYSGATTDDTSPLLTGSSAPNIEITTRRKYNDGSWSYSSLNSGHTGFWGLNPVNLQKGTWTFEVQKVGGTGWNSFILIIDPTVDRTPLIEYAADNVGPITDNLASGATTDDTTPTLHGTAAANTLISLRYKSGSGSWATTSITVDDDGDWTWTPAALAQGNWTFEVQKQGQSDWHSFTLNIDPLYAPSVPVIVDFLDDVGSKQSPVVPDGTKAITDDTTPTLRGTGSANSIIYIQSAKEGDGWGNLGSVRADGNGDWTYTPSPLEASLWQFRVKAGNSAGESAWSKKVYLTIDPTVDLTPTIDYAQDNVGPVQDNLSSGATTDDTTPTLHGKAAANSVIFLRYSPNSVPGTVISITVNSEGNWTWTPPPLANGDWTFEVQKAGQEDWHNFKLNIKTTPVRPATIDYADDNVGFAQGPVYNGGSTDDTTPTIHGSGPANSSFVIRYGDGKFASTTVNTDNNGKWSWTPVLSKDLLWIFQIKNQNDGKWGEEFTLYVTGPLKAKIDFEISDTIFYDSQPYVWPDIDATVTFSLGGGFIFTRPTGNPQFGNSSLFVAPRQLIFVNFGTHSGKKLASEFSFDFQSVTTNVTESAAFAVQVRDQNGNSYNFSYSSDAGVIKAYHALITSASIGGNYISSVRIQGITNSNFAALDNIAWKYPAKLLTQENQQENITQPQEMLLDDIKPDDEASITAPKNQQATLDLKDVDNHDFTLNGESLLLSGQENIFIDNDKIQMRVSGEKGDVIGLQQNLLLGSNIESWIHQSGTVTVAGVKYDVYSYGNDAELLVQQGVKTELV